MFFSSPIYIKISAKLYLWINASSQWIYLYTKTFVGPSIYLLNPQCQHSLPTVSLDELRGR